MEGEPAPKPSTPTVAAITPTAPAGTDGQATHGQTILGLTEAFRARDAGAMNYTFWDYQAGAWNKNHGIRIDHFLLSPECADMLTDCQIDRHTRGREKPSDHVPIWVELAEVAAQARSSEGSAREQT